MESASPTRPTNPASVQKPSNEALKAAMDRFVAKAAETVSRLPPHMRTILSKSEVQNRS